MSSRENVNLLELLPLARQLSEANEVLLDREFILRQLSLFKIVSLLLKGPQSNSDKLFKIEWKILPGLNSNESLLIIVENTSDKFEFSEKFWSISVSFSNGNVHNWNFVKMFKFGDVEKLSLEFEPEFLTCGGRGQGIGKKIEISFIFAMQWAQVNYTRTFLLCSFSVDILHCVSPGRRLSLQASKKLTAELYRNKYPVVSKFCVRVNEKLQEEFVEKILLRDSFVSRGFAQEDSRSDVLKISKEFHSYYYDEKIICSKEAQNLISIHCTNPRVLHLVKDAVYTRLIDLCERRLVRIKCSDVDENSGLLYQVKLQLESLVANSKIETPLLLEMYFKFREASESLLSFTING